MIASMLAEAQASLPVPPNRLVGRERDIAAVGAMLSDPAARLVTLTGPGGVGKTHLAIEAASVHAAQFPDGVLFVSLAPVREPHLVLPTIAQALGLREARGQAMIEVLGNALSGQNMLIVLDNLEQIMEAAPDIGVLLAATERLRILATSRSPLRLRIEREFPVQPLGLPTNEKRPSADSLAQNAAITLFVERSRAARPSFALTDANAPIIAEICRRLDGLPLAIELAAAMTPVLSPQALLSRLERRLPLLVLGATDLPDRQRTLRDAIDWSYDLLEEDERTLFRRLSVFAGGATLEAIDAVSDATIDVLTTVSSLVTKSLLLRVDEGDGILSDEPQFRMLTTIREFAEEELSNAGESDTAHSRHLDWLLDIAAQAEVELTGANQVSWLLRLDAEHDNIRAALAWATERAPERGTRLASLIWRYWATRGLLTEGYSWLCRFLDAPEAASVVADAVRAKAFGSLGNLCIDLGDYAKATEAYSQALELWERLGEKRGIANTLNGLGLVDWYRGDNQSARDRHERALALRREIGDRFGQSNSLTNLGNAIKDSGDAEGSRTYHEQALAIRQELGDRGGVGYSYINLGDIGRRLGDADTARQMFRKSLDAFRDVGDRLGLGYALQGLGMAEKLSGNGRVAAGHFVEALEIRTSLGDRRGMVECIEGIAAVLATRADYTNAATLFGAAEMLREQIGAPLPEPDRVVFDPAITSVRRALPVAEFTSLWSAGLALTLQDAAALARAVAERVVAEPEPEPAPAAEQSVLSEREIEVVRLVASGMTNAEVADRLYLSRRTVDAHLRRIYDKLDLPSRSDVIRYAIEHGLT